MKRKLIALLLIVASIATLTACGSKSEKTSGNEDNTETKKEAVTILVPTEMVETATLNEDGTWTGDLGRYDGPPGYFKMEELPETDTHKDTLTGEIHEIKKGMFGTSCAGVGFIEYICDDCEDFEKRYFLSSAPHTYKSTENADGSILSKCVNCGHEETSKSGESCTLK